MKAYRCLTTGKAPLQKRVFLALLVIAAGVSPIQRAAASANVILWDTVSPLADTLNIESRAGRQPVPSDLLTLEADPPTASSDPGYYGREYSFKGDAVVENQKFVAVFWAAPGRVVVYAKPDAAVPTGVQNARLGKKLIEVVPLQTKTQPMAIKRCNILRNGDDEVALEVSFSAKGSPDVSGIFAFGKTEIIEIKPAENMKTISLRGAIEYGIVPGFIGDDLIFDGAESSSVNTLCLPSENLFLGLLKGEESELVMTWPKGKQQIRLQLGA